MQRDNHKFTLEYFSCQHNAARVRSTTARYEKDGVQPENGKGSGQANFLRSLRNREQANG
eukprot:2399194-Amphidinium_carterae.1